MYEISLNYNLPQHQGDKRKLSQQCPLRQSSEISISSLIRLSVKAVIEPTAQPVKRFGAHMRIA